MSELHLQYEGEKKWMNKFNRNDHSTRSSIYSLPKDQEHASTFQPIAGATFT